MRSGGSKTQLGTWTAFEIVYSTVLLQAMPHLAGSAELHRQTGLSIAQNAVPESMHARFHASMDWVELMTGICTTADRIECHAASSQSWRG